MTAPIAFVDTETFGLNPDVHPIWEIAVIRGDDEHRWQVWRSASQLAMADSEALTINGYYDRAGQGLVLTPLQSIERFVEITDGCHLAGAVVSFDEERIRREYVELLGFPDRFPWNYHVIDVEAMAVGALTAAGHRVELPWNSDDLSERLGVQAEPGRHSALADARWAKAIYEACGGPL